MGPLAYGGIALGSSLLGGLFGGDDDDNTAQIMSLLTSGKGDINRMMSALAGRDMTSAIVPDESVFESALGSKIKGILSKIPAAQQNFNSDLASRGIFGSGEAPGRLYADVYAPISAEASTAASEGMASYAQLAMQGKIAAEQLHSNAVTSWADSLTQIMGMQSSALQNSDDSSGWEDFFSTGTSLAGLGAMKEWNIIG